MYRGSWWCEIQSHSIAWPYSPGTSECAPAWRIPTASREEGETSLAIPNLFPMHLAHAWVLLDAGTGGKLLDLPTLAQQLENGISLGAVYALIALGYTMVYGIIELINFAHGDVFMWGSFAALALVTALQTPDHLTGLSLVFTLAAALILAVAVGAGLNVAIERLAYRPLRNAPRLALLISAIGASFILEDAAKLWKGPSPMRFPPIFPDVAI